MSSILVNPTDERTGLLDEHDDHGEIHENEVQYNPGKAQTLSPTTADYEEALLATGFGKFNFLLLALCGWAQISDSIEILSVSFLLPVMTIDGEPLNDFEKGVLNSTIFAGMMVGGYFWGALSDIRGRKMIIIISLFMNAIFGFISSLAQSYWLFVTCRFFSGVGVGGTMPVIFSYFGEMQQSRYRGAMISCLSTCWMMGNILTAALAWWIIPLDSIYQSASWRVFIAVCIVPALTAALTFLFLPESPKFLLENGREEEALAVLKKIFKTNLKQGNPERAYKIRHLVPSDKTHSRRGQGGQLSTVMQVVRSTADLFVPPVLRTTLALIIITFSLSFGYYGLWMWFPQIFAQVEYGNGTACSSGVVHIPKGDSAIYRDAFLTALSNLPGNILTILFMDKLGRKFLMALSLILSGVSAFFIWFVTTRTQVLITSLCFGGATVIAWNTINVLGVELFPTRLRSTSSGVRSILNRIGAILGNLLFGILIHVHCSVPLLVVAVLLAIAGFTTFTLPDTTKAALK